ncbi:MAG: PilZ domain-containing protein [Planctomycetes bacterium]|nr:PilZ domain-containing protein [Planctomycetota bacterium]
MGKARAEEEAWARSLPPAPPSGRSPLPPSGWLPSGFHSRRRHCRVRPRARSQAVVRHGFAIRLGLPWAAPRRALVLDVSEGGVGLLSPEAIERGTVVRVELELVPGRGPVLARGTVRWCRLHPGGAWEFALGVQFAGLEAAQAEVLSRVVRGCRAVS